MTSTTVAVGAEAAGTEVAGAEPPARLTRADLLRMVLRPLAIFVATRAGVVAIASGVSLLGKHSLEYTLTRWDAGAYITIAKLGYQSHLPSPTASNHAWSLRIVFFPLWPLLIRLGHLISGIGYDADGLILAAAAGAVGAVLIWFLVRERYGEQAADRATALVFCFPGAFVLSTTYSENLLIPLVAGMLIALGRRRWVIAGVLAALATAVDPTAIAVVVPCVVAAGIAIYTKRNWAAISAAVLSPLGALGYFAYLWAHTGTPRAWFDVERRGWGNHPTLASVWDQFIGFERHPFAYPNATAQMAGFVVAIALLVVAIRFKADLIWISYGCAVFLLASLTPQVGFMPRIVLHAFPLIAVAGVALRRTWFTSVLVLSALLMALMAVVSLGTLYLTP